ncbi:MAG: FAD-binding oxidoreductase [Gammaproteobacteria bacterium]|nr:FAD-binding oxidoreductase [Gammaproteobacteria bacterium]
MSKLLDQLHAVTGPGGVLAGEAMAGYGPGPWDGGRPVQAMAVVQPATPAQVAAVVAACHAARQPLVVHGGRTGLVHGTDSRAGEVVLSLARLRRIEAVDAVGRTLTAEAGVTLQTAQEAAESAGLLLPLDMGSRGSATLGGVAATNAGGNRVLRYGMARMLVLGLEAVLADGTVVSALNRMLKNNAGFDLKHVFIGSEGTLGVITRLVMRLQARPQSRQTALVALHDFAGMTALLNRVDAGLGGTLSAFEALWQSYYRYVTGPGAGRTPPLAGDYPYYVLLEAEGGEAGSDARRFEDVLAQAAEAGLIADAVITRSDRERDALWALRDDVMRLTLLRPLFLFDVSAPLVAMEAYVDAVRGALMARWPEAHCYTFGHLADGNLHLAVSAGDPAGADRAEVERLVYGPLQAIGGSVSAEHGIGLEKKPYLALCRSPAELALMRTLKSTLDPHGLLNPGKVI